MIKTPLLQGEHVHLVEAHADMAAAERRTSGGRTPSTTEASPES